MLVGVLLDYKFMHSKCYHICINIINCTHGSPSSKTDSHFSGRETPTIYLNLSISYRVRKSLLLAPT
jgi:hypothetical protein